MVPRHVDPSRAGETSSSSTSSKPVHLVILIHGLFGSPANVATVAEELHYVHQYGTDPEAGKAGGGEAEPAEEQQTELEDGPSGARRYREPTETPEDGTGGATGKSGNREGSRPWGTRGDEEELVVYACNSFGWGHTWDGVDINAQRAAKEVDNEVRRLEEDEGKRVKWISVLGYSLGGLIARYLIGVLAARSPNFFERHKPAAFVTVATPHLGVVKYGTTTNTIIHTIGRRLFSRTGRQLYCRDADENGRSLLEVMADPQSVFVQGLKAFNRVLIVANGCHDLTVPYPTASISLSDPFQDYAAGTAPLDIEIDKRNIVTSYSRASPPSPAAMDPIGEVESLQRDDDDIRITVTIAPAPDSALTKEKKAVLTARPLLPPFLYLKWPFTYALLAVLPLIIPLWLVVVFCFMTLQSYRSAKRHRMLASSGEHEPLLAAALVPAKAAHPAVTSIRNTASSNWPNPSSRDGTATPPFELIDTVSDGMQLQVPLYLTDKQKTMVRNLNGALPHMERLVSWFPWAFNAHATLIMRDYRKFPSQEAARGVIKEIAGRILEAP